MLLGFCFYFESPKNIMHSNFIYLAILIYLLVRFLSLVLGNYIISKKINFSVISFKCMLLILWDIVYEMLLAILVIAFTGVYTDNIITVISVIFYIVIWIMEMLLILPWIFKKGSGFEYIVNKKLNLFIMSSVHRIIFFILFFILYFYMYQFFHWI